MCNWIAQQLVVAKESSQRDAQVAKVPYDYHEQQSFADYVPPVV